MKTNLKNSLRYFQRCGYRHMLIGLRVCVCAFVRSFVYACADVNVDVDVEAVAIAANVD